MGTNNDTGYVLTMSTDSTDLVNVADSSKVIETLPSLSGGYTDTTFLVNKWGYKKNRLTDNYNAFPATSTLLQNSTRTNADTANMRFATKVDYMQPSGLYNTTINFQLVENPPIYMQDVTSSMCTTTPSTVADIRDGSRYMIKRLADGNCWMVQNLNFTGGTNDPANTMVLNTETSNVQKDITISYADLTSGNSYDQARIHISGNSTKGVWYNYAAATAMNVTGSSNSNNATSDICPRGWRMPNSAEITTITTSISSDVSVFNPVIGSYYYGGGLEPYPTSGLWWGSTTSTAARRDYLRYDEGSGLSLLNGDRVGGYYVRCILDTRTLSNITYMQEMTPTIAANTADNTYKNLIDRRDSKSYTIKKLNGHVWMAQNSTIGCNNAGTAISQIPLTIADSDVSSAGTTTTNTFVSGTSSTTQAQMACSNTYGGTYGGGGYYNHTATSAGTVYSGSGVDLTVDSICPRGWKIPTQDESRDLYGYETQSNATYSGYYYNGSGPTSGNGTAYWWLANGAADTARYTLSYSSGSYGGGGGSIGYGFNLRCIARE